MASAKKTKTLSNPLLHGARRFSRVQLGVVAAGMVLFGAYLVFGIHASSGAPKHGNIYVTAYRSIGGNAHAERLPGVTIHLDRDCNDAPTRDRVTRHTSDGDNGTVLFTSCPVDRNTNVGHYTVSVTGLPPDYHMADSASKDLEVHWADKVAHSDLNFIMEHDTVATPPSSIPTTTPTGPPASANNHTPGSIQVTTYEFINGSPQRVGGRDIHFHVPPHDVSDTAHGCSSNKGTTSGNNNDPNYGQVHFDTCWIGTSTPQRYQFTQVDPPAGDTFRSLHFHDIYGDYDSTDPARLFNVHAAHETSVAIYYDHPTSTGSGSGSSPPPPAAPKPSPGSPPAASPPPAASTSQARSSAPAPVVAADKGAIQVTSYIFGTPLKRLSNTTVQIKSVGHSPTDISHNCSDFLKTTDTNTANSANYAQAHFNNCWLGGNSHVYRLNTITPPTGYKLRSIHSDQAVSSTEGPNAFTVTAGKESSVEIWLDPTDIGGLAGRASAPSADDLSNVFGDCSPDDLECIAPDLFDSSIFDGLLGDDTTPPTKPGNLAAAETNPGMVELTWQESTDDSGDLVYYSVERSTDGLNWTFIDDGGADSPVFDDVAASYGTHYYYRVAANDYSGNQSGYAVSEIITQPFSPNTTTAGSVNLASKNGAAQATVSGLSTEAICALISDPNNSHVLDGVIPDDFTQVAAEYDTICRDSSGGDVDDPNDSIDLSFELDESSIEAEAGLDDGQLNPDDLAVVDTTTGETLDTTVTKDADTGQLSVHAKSDHTGKFSVVLASDKRPVGTTAIWLAISCLSTLALIQLLIRYYFSRQYQHVVEAMAPIQSSMPPPSAPNPASNLHNKGP